MNSNRFHRRAQRAFTLFEMLIVIALIALLAGVAITNVDKIFGQNQETICRIFVNDTMKAPLTSFRIHMGSYPTTAQGLQALITAPDSASDKWKGPYIESSGGKVPEDPWGRPYQYRYPGTKNTDRYDLYSWGPDGVESADDIGNW